MTASAPEPGKTTAPEPVGSDAHRDILWQPRVAVAANSVERYSRFVAAMKIALPAAAAVLLLLVVLLPLIRKDDERFRIGMQPIKGSNTETLSMTKARYFGTDDEGQPYAVTADGVRQRNSDERAIDLVVPKAEIKLTSGTTLSASAATGVYDRDNQTLDLSGDVTVLHDDGHHLRTAAARIMLHEGTASGRAPVSGESSFGTMQAAGGFDLSERGKVMVFHGPARLILNPASPTSAGAAAVPAKPAGGKP